MHLKYPSETSLITIETFKKLKDGESLTILGNEFTSLDQFKNRIETLNQIDFEEGTEVVFEIFSSPLTYKLFNLIRSVTLNISSTVKKVNLFSLIIGKFKINSKNSKFQVIDDSLYEDDGTRLVAVDRTRQGEFIVPDNVKTIESTAFYGCYGLTDIKIGKNIKLLNVFLSTNNLKTIEVDPNNSYFTSVDGVLYSKNLIRLVQVPSNNQTFKTCPPEVKALGRYSISHNKYLESLPSILKYL